MLVENIYMHIVIDLDKNNFECNQRAIYCYLTNFFSFSLFAYIVYCCISCLFIHITIDIIYSVRHIYFILCFIDVVVSIRIVIFLICSFHLIGILPMSYVCFVWVHVVFMLFLFI